MGHRGSGSAGGKNDRPVKHRVIFLRRQLQRRAQSKASEQDNGTCRVAEVPRLREKIARGFTQRRGAESMIQKAKVICGSLLMVRFSEIRPARQSISRTSSIICLNAGVPETSHHSKRAASVVVNVAPAESMRRKAVS